MRGPAYTQRVRSLWSPETPARKALWLAGLLLTLAGLVAMHGLSGHGVSGGAHDMASVMAAQHGSAMAEPGLADPGHPDGTNARAGTAVVTTAIASVRDGVTDHDGLMALCVAILVAALGALLRRLAATQTITTLARSSEPTRRWAQLRGRDRDPPSLTVLSIQRC